MARPPHPRTGARLLVDALASQGVKTCFGVPGESYLAVLDALVDSSIDFVTCRQEGGAAMMAEAAGKLTGQPGICFVTRGPGATNAAAGVHVASQDSTPMILFVGQIETGFRGREAFQELDYRAVFGSMAKWVVEIDEPARVPELIARAFRVATQGRPGPVVIALPEDMLVAEADVPDAPVYPQARTAPGRQAMDDFAARLAGAARPIALVGGSGWSEASVASLTRAAGTMGLPVATTFRRQMLFPASHPCFAGHLGIGPNPKLVKRIKESDLVLLIGTRLSEMPSQSYELLGIPDPGMPLVHVHSDAEELGRVYQPVLAIHAEPDCFAPALEEIAGRVGPRWKSLADEAHAEERAWSEMAPAHPGEVQLGEVMMWLRGRLPKDAIVTNGAGNYASWIHRFYRFEEFGTQLAPTSGSMGYGLPAAVAAKKLHSDRPVVAFAGDGCFMMTCHEFATAVQHDLPLVVVVVDNGIYGTIRMHQERHYPGRISGTRLVNPDFAAMAQAFGGHAERVERTDEFAPAFERAVASGRPALIHVKFDPEAITPTTTLTAIRAAAHK
ncbi:acetolactate synthase large subunit [Agaricicola taiwanensis]|uniref:Acetolactate synthase large subunit n=1 Tax=Agaricicola taiwanensis TaxID=591372 RepID=A0A8J2YF48_9RHOB|nr:thiamine pyrophosphate-binding protein [Agaricicola taiwanensis]GGE30564.1 acetolactate synthase large subunit [Agaricicola taiwanensis]